MRNSESVEVMKMQYQFLLTSLVNSDRIVNSLRGVGIKDSDVHFISEKTSDFSGHHVHEASMFEERDLVHSSVRMGFVGFLVGAAVCAAVTALQPYGWQPTLINYAFFCLLFVGFGGWIGGLSGISHRNYRINEYQTALEDGKALMLVYTDEAHEEALKSTITHDFPDTRYLRKASQFDNPFINASTVELEH